MRRLFPTSILALLVLATAPPDIWADDKPLPTESRDLLSKLGDYRPTEMQACRKKIADAEKSGLAILAKHVERETKSGNLDAALALKKIDRLAGLAELDLKLPADSKALIEKFQAFEAEQTNELQRQIKEKEIAVAKVLEGHMTQLSKQGDLEGALALRDTIAKLSEPDPAGEAPETTGVSSPAHSQRSNGAGRGRIRVAGVLMPKLPASVPELDSLPTDFVEVHAYRTAWIGIRANGDSFVAGLNSPKTEIQTRSDMRFELIGKSYDPWCYTRGAVHRLVNWNLNRPSNIRNPIAIAGGHSTGVLLDSRGRAELHGGVSHQVTVPAESMRENVKALYATKHSFMVIDKDDQASVWNMRAGEVIPIPLLDGVKVRDVDCGQEHYVFLDEEGNAHSFSVRDGTLSPGTTPTDLGTVSRVKAGGFVSAAQLKDGTWRAWGSSSTFVPEAVQKAGLAADLDIYTGEGADYVIWIEPTDR